jgi:hypothetical protein
MHTRAPARRKQASKAKQASRPDPIASTPAERTVPAVQMKPAHQPGHPTRPANSEEQFHGPPKTSNAHPTHLPSAKASRRCDDAMTILSRTRYHDPAPERDGPLP